MPPLGSWSQQAAVQNVILQDPNHLYSRARGSPRSWDSELEMSASPSGKGWSGAMEPGLSVCGRWVATLPCLTAISQLSRHLKS